MAQETFRVGIVSFLSGQAADSFGIPAVNGAKVLVDAFNNGQAPAPFNKKGFGGMKFEAVYVDEAGGATKQVQELRNLYDREKVDAVVGYVGSGDCLAVAPVAEEMKKFLILYDCGTPRIFEEKSYNYVFRTAAHATMDNVALARYLKAKNIKADSFNMINQDYAWGQDSKKDFAGAMSKLFPNAKAGEDQLPKFGAGQLQIHGINPPGGGPRHFAFAPDVKLNDGDVIQGDGWNVEAVYTPGHISNHLCFAVKEDKALLSGDHVMGWSTAVISHSGRRRSPSRRRPCCSNRPPTRCSTSST